MRTEENDYNPWLRMEAPKVEVTFDFAFAESAVSLHNTLPPVPD